MPRLGHDRLDDPPVSISRHLQQAADLLRRALVAEELLLALPDGRVLECESARAAEGGVQGGGEEARHGEVLRSFRVAGRFAARSDWQADLGDFEREVDRDVRTIALNDQGGGRRRWRSKAPHRRARWPPSASTQSVGGKLPSMTRRYLAIPLSNFSCSFRTRGPAGKTICGGRSRRHCRRRRRGLRPFPREILRQHHWGTR